MIGNVYYRALEAATGSRRLQALCRLMVADELVRVAYHAEALIAIRQQRAALPRLAVSALHRMFLSSTALVVWAVHRRALARAGHRPMTFLRAFLAQYEFYLSHNLLSVVLAR